MTPVEKDAINKFLTLSLGECWHKWVPAYGHPFKCKLCGYSQYHYSLPNEGWPHSDFSTWEGFGKLWEWAQNQIWFGTFLKTIVPPIDRDNMVIYCSAIHPERFAIAIYNFLESNY